MFGWKWQGWSLGWKRIEGKFTWSRSIPSVFRQRIPDGVKLKPEDCPYKAPECAPIENLAAFNSQWERVNDAAAGHLADEKLKAQVYKTHRKEQ